MQTQIGLSVAPAPKVAPSLPVYVLAVRAAKSRWVGVATWCPRGGSSCLASAEDAFRMAGFSVDDGASQVAWGESISRQKNYSPGVNMQEVGASVAEVSEWADLRRAKEYLAAGWNLDSQPEAKAVAIKHGLIRCAV